MIGRLHGKILEKHPPELLLDVNGVAYEMQASMNTFYKLPDVGNDVTIHTQLIVREDAHLLYGFYELSERKLFRSLVKVNGVGPKMAIAILSTMDPDSFVRCVENQYVNDLVRIPGVGKKTAERLIIEMRDRLTDWHIESPSIEIDAPHMASVPARDTSHDAITALIALGYRPQEASRAISKISDPELSVEELIRQALKNMG